MFKGLAILIRAKFCNDSSGQQKQLPDERPDYFKPVHSRVDAVLFRIKGNFRRRLVSKNLLQEGLSSIPEDLFAHELPDYLKDALAAQAGPQARGGEDLPDLQEGEVEVARLTLVNSVHGEVTSLRAKGNQNGSNILLRMVDEYETIFKLSSSTICAPLTAEEVLFIFRDAEPSPLDTSCKVEFESFYYPRLDALATELKISAANS